MNKKTELNQTPEVEDLENQVVRELKAGWQEYIKHYGNISFEDYLKLVEQTNQSFDGDFS